MFTVGITKKGPVADYLSELFAEAAISGVAGEGGYVRRLASPSFNAAYMRQQDILNRVASAQFVAGFVGRDQLEEFNAKSAALGVVETFSGAACRLCIAAPMPIDDLQKLSGRRLGVSSCLQNVVRKILEEGGVTPRGYVIVDGSVEALVALREVDAIVDLVQSGNTLRANGLVEGLELMRSSTVMVAQKDVADAVNGAVLMPADLATEVTFVQDLRAALQRSSSIRALRAA